MIGLEVLYTIAGLMFAAFALFNLTDRTNPRRVVNFAFWMIYAATFLFGALLPHFVTGCLAITLAVIAGSGNLGRGKANERSTTAVARPAAGAPRLGNRLFLPALLIPAITLAGTFALKNALFIDTKSVTLVSLVLGTLSAFVVALVMLRESPAHGLREARYTMDAVGWAAILPQMLAALGAVFAIAGVGGVISGLVTTWMPASSPLAIVIAYTVGMALFTMIMGNAFAAFPVMTAGIGLPLIVHDFHGNPAILGAIGMLSGFCGTLMTPMAANFNIVPAALLELKDKSGVIKAQWPTAVLLLVVNTVLMAVLVFRF